jgi:hypothetical protein
MVENLSVDVDDGTALNLACEHTSHNFWYFGEGRHLRRPRELVQIEITSQSRLGLKAEDSRRIDRVDAGEGDAAHDEGQHRSGKIHALGETV